ncbi:MAG: ClpXP protease specificity-enhancing factor SspB [Rickettsiaceae bacterium]
MIINYNKLLNDSMLELIRKVMYQIQGNGLIGDHHLYITFKTKYPGVVLSKRVRATHENEITVVLQHQFHSLKISNDKICVNISFDGIEEMIEIPFLSIILFSDPSVGFNLKLNNTVSDLDKKNDEHKKYDNVVSLSQFRQANKSKE